jgi:N-hydroxyarylamine O-acetyltransferase
VTDVDELIELLEREFGLRLPHQPGARLALARLIQPV